MLECAEKPDQHTGKARISTLAHIVRAAFSVSGVGLAEPDRLLADKFPGLAKRSSSKAKGE